MARIAVVTGGGTGIGKAIAGALVTEGLASVAAFLASPSAGHVAGQVIHVSGGAARFL